MLGLTTYTTLKSLHVLFAIVAVGFNASYGIWLAAAARNPEHTGFVLRRIKVLDDRLANPAYAMLLVIGLSMVWVGDLDLTTFWLAAALVLYGVLLVLGMGVYTPTLRRQIHALDERGSASPGVRRTRQARDPRRGRTGRGGGGYRLPDGDKAHPLTAAS